MNSFWEDYLACRTTLDTILLSDVHSKRSSNDFVFDFPYSLFAVVHCKAVAGYDVLLAGQVWRSRLLNKKINEQ